MYPADSRDARKPSGKLRAERGLFKFALTGKELDAFIKDRMVAYRQLAGEFKLKVAN